MNQVMVNTKYQHIQCDEKGVAIIAGIKIKVVELVVEYLAYGWSPEELHFQHPELSLGQIHAALAYYWDHRDIMNADIKNRMDKIDGLNKKHSNPKLYRKINFEKAS